jgi:hypothetical protein
MPKATWVLHERVRTADGLVVESEEAYEFEGLEKLRADFRRDLGRARRRIAEGKGDWIWP